MKPVILLAAFAALAITAAAQQPPAAPQPGSGTQAAPSFDTAWMQKQVAPAVDSLTLDLPQSAACPVGLKASFNVDGGMIKVRKSGSPDAQPAPDRRPSQQIHLKLGSRGRGSIASLRVTAYGLTARGRVDRAGDAMVKGSSDIRRTMDVVQFSTDKDGSLSADLFLPGFTAVYSVKLESITYADGSIREFSGKSVCSVPVNGIMLISGR